MRVLMGFAGRAATRRPGLRGELRVVVSAWNLLNLRSQGCGWGIRSAGLELGFGLSTWLGEQGVGFGAALDGVRLT